MNKNYKVSTVNLAKIKKNLKTAAVVSIGGFAIISLLGCSSCKNKTTEEVTTENVIIDEVVAEDTIEADEKIYTLQDDAVIACNNALEVGIDLSYDNVVDENDIDTYAKQFTNYLIVTNMDKYNNKLFAEMMIDSNVSSEDLVESFMNINTAFKKHIITVTYDNLFEFNNLYNKEDAEILNHAQKLIATMNENELDSDERKEAAKEFYTYATEIINSTNARIAISPQALDTLVTFIEAYDELTFNYRNKKIAGAYVDDELEHALNISKESCFGVADDSKLAVEDSVVENFKSLYRTHILKDLNNKYLAAKEERSLQLQIGNTLNDKNSYDSIITYVKEHIKIDLYNELDCDYQTWLKVLKGVIAVEKGEKTYGNISDKQLKEYGIKTEGKTPEQIKKELEEAVKAQENKKSEQSKVVTKTDVTGKDADQVQPINGTTADAQNGYTAGYAAGQSGKYNCPAGVSDAYKIAYDNGYAAGQANAKEMQEKYKEIKTTYEPVENGETKTEETTKTEDYIPTPEPTIPFLPELEEEFVPVDEEVVETYEIIQTLSSISTGNLKNELITYRNILISLPKKDNNKTFSYKI